MEYVLQVLRGREGITTLKLNASTESEAAKQAVQQGYTVLSVKTGGQFSAIFPSQSNFSLLLFSQELLALLRAGLSVVESLETLTEKEAQSEARVVLQKIVRGLHEGQSFSVALESFPDVFPALFISTLRAAEKTSDLGSALSRYITYKMQIDSVRRKIVSAAIYPVLLLVVGGAVILFLMMYVVPRFSGIYESTSGQLPWMSRLLLQWGKLLSEHGFIVMLGLIFLAAVAGYAVTLTKVREQLTRWLWDIPAIGYRMHLFQLARLYRTMGMLLSGGIPIVSAGAMAEELMPVALQNQVHRAMHAIKQGQSVSRAMADHGLTTPVASRMLRVGERTGNMGAMMDSIAAFYEDDMARWVDWFTRLFEPLLMTVIGIVVGVIVVLMYVPIFELAGSLQ